jgi:hypothetical protein
MEPICKIRNHKHRGLINPESWIAAMTVDSVGTPSAVANSPWMQRVGGSLPNSDVICYSNRTWGCIPLSKRVECMDVHGIPPVIQCYIYIYIHTHIDIHTYIYVYV